MGHHYLPAALAAAAAIACVIASGTASAQQKHPLEINSEGTKGRYVQQLAIDVDDAAGHQVRVLELQLQRTYPPGKEPLIDGERIVETWTRGFSNYTAGVGPTWAYTTWTTGNYNGTSKIVGGTGRFAGLRGVMIDTSDFDTGLKVGYSRSTSRGEYWFGQ